MCNVGAFEGSFGNPAPYPIELEAIDDGRLSAVGLVGRAFVRIEVGVERQTIRRQATKGSSARKDVFPQPRRVGRVRIPAADANDRYGFVCD